MESGINDKIRSIIESEIDESSSIDLYSDEKLDRPVKGFIGLSRNHVKAMKMISDSIKMQLEALKLAYGLDYENDPNFTETPERIAKMMILEKMSGINSHGECIRLLSNTFPTKRMYDQIVIGANPALANSTCPHHFENVSYKIYVGYVPMKKIVGISKINRVVKLWANQPLLQEDYTEDIAQMIQHCLQPKGVIVVVYGQHGCMTTRGVNSQPDQWMVTSAVTGKFENEKTFKDEFFKLCNLR